MVEGYDKVTLDGINLSWFTETNQNLTRES